VNGVGNASSTGGIYGIDATGGEAADCLVTGIGNIAMTASCSGVLARGTSRCRVANLSGAGGINGISGGSAIQSTVETITQGATVSGVVNGINSTLISDCRVTQLGGNTGSSTNGFAGYRFASGCVAESVVNSGSGTSAGFAPGTSGQTINCTVDSASNTGVLAQSIGCCVRGCNVRLNVSGTGINASGSNCRVEDNMVAFCTNGITAGGANCLVVKNRITNCTVNLTSSASSQTGPTVPATGTIASTSPWANFTD
jgi:hypothetical protein